MKSSDEYLQALLLDVVESYTALHTSTDVAPALLKLMQSVRAQERAHLVIAVARRLCDLRQTLPLDMRPDQRLGYEQAIDTVLLLLREVDGLAVAETLS